MSSFDFSTFSPEQLAVLAKAVQAEQEKRPVVLTKEQENTVDAIDSLMKIWTNMVGMTEVYDATGWVDASVSWANFTDLVNSKFDMSVFDDDTQTVMLRVSDRIPFGVVKNNGDKQRVQYRFYKRGMKQGKYVLEFSPVPMI